MSDEPDPGGASALPDKMDIHEFRASRRRKTDNLLKEDHRDLKRFFALDSAAYRDLSKDGGLDEKTKELLGLVASTVLRCNDCIAYHCDRCVEVGWKKSELLDALNVALVIGGSITIPHIRTVWEVVEDLYEEKEAQRRAKEGHPGLKAAAEEVKANVVERDSDAIATLGLPPEAHSRKARTAKREAGPPPVPRVPAAPVVPPMPTKMPSKMKAETTALPPSTPARTGAPPSPPRATVPTAATALPKSTMAGDIEIRPDARATKDPAHVPKTKPAPPAGTPASSTSPPTPPVVKAEKTQSKKSQGV